MWTNTPVRMLSVAVLSLLGMVMGQQCGTELTTCYDNYYASFPGMMVNSLWLLKLAHAVPLNMKCTSLATCLSGSDSDNCLENCKYYLNSSRKKRGAIQCNPAERYRRITGVCNNLQNPLWGSVMRPYNRLVPSAYDDGVSTPRQTSACSGTLPSARAISNIIHQAEGLIRLERHASYMTMQWGLAITLDIALTPLESGSPDCCGADMANEPCFPIVIPPFDPSFDTDCMSFIRSKGIIGPSSGNNEQMNGQTAFIDGSLLYGPTVDVQTSLRAAGGLLNSVGKKLGIDPDDSTCRLRLPQNDIDNYCALSGDLRVHLVPGQTAVHTVLHREHNRIVRKLALINPHWDGDTLYGEARKIVAALIQLITYREWLPVVLGKRTVRSRGLAIRPRGFFDTYDDTIDASLDNGFAAAIFRFGHSQIHDIVARRNKKRKLIDKERLEDHYFSPILYHLDGEFGTDALINWITTAKCPKTDRFFQRSARDLLLEDSQGNRFDLAALNIQRGRDHGLPSYNEYREFCGLPRATHFGTGPGGLVDHPPSVAALLDEAYNGCIDDLDLFVGSLTETRNKGALTGPLQQCILVKEFQKLRDGDRFWFERNDPVTGFTEAQLNEIKKVRLSSIICANTSIKSMQKYALLAPSKSKRRNYRSLIRCDKLPQINFRHWRDRR